MKNNCSKYLGAVTSAGASDEHPMSTRSASDGRRWHSRGMHVICTLVLLFTFAIGNVWAANNAPKSTKENKGSINAVEQQTSVKDSTKNEAVVGNAEEERETENIGVKLSGDYSLRLIEESNETNWTAIIAIISILANIAMVILTYILQTRLKQVETAEIRTQKIQEVELKQQASMYEMLKDIDNFLIEKDDVLWEESDKGVALQRELDTKIAHAEDFHKNNTMYIRGRLGQLTANLLAEYKEEKDGNRNAESMNKTREMLNEYVDVYHNHPKK